MNYLISKFDCILFGKQIFQIYSGAKYLIENINIEDIFLIIDQNGNSYFVNFYDILINNVTNSNILKFNIDKDNYIILFENLRYPSSVVEAKSKNKYLISTGSKLVLSENGEKVFSNELANISFEGLETKFNFDFLFFQGERKAVVILSDRKVKFADYYDEYNQTEKTKMFMKNLNTTLNHGLVFECGEDKVENYLVYLNEKNFEIREDFIVSAFLDCIKVNDYKFAAKQMKEENVEIEKLKNFFEEFDDFIILNKTNVAIVKKNTLAGIYKFEIINSKIENIIDV